MTYSPRLGPNEIKVLARLDQRRDSRITIAEARELVGAGAAKTLSAMAAKGILDRVGRGIYIARPLRAIGRPWAISAFVAIEHALRGMAHYVGGQAALTVHRLTGQVHSSVVDVFVERKHRHRIVANAQIRYHVSTYRELTIGVEPLAIEGSDVMFSNRERTLIDALAYPAIFGGLTEGVRILDVSISHIDVSQLIGYGLELWSISNLQRLGVILERHGASTTALNRVQRAVGRRPSVISLFPGRRTGHLNTRWRVLENDALVHAYRASSTS